MTGDGPHGARVTSAATSGAEGDGAPLPRGPSLTAMVVLSVALHLLAVGMGVALLRLWPDTSEPEPQVISARLVRLGELRPQDQLPDLAAPAPAPPAPARPIPPPPAPAPPPPAPAPPAAGAPPSPPVAPAPPAKPAAAPAQPSPSVQEALKRLKKRAEGAADGARDGEVARADAASESDAFRAEIEARLRSKWVIVGDAGRQLGSLKAALLVRMGGDGRLLSVKIATSSGSQIFDDSVERAMKLCDHLPAPPQFLRRRVRHEGILIDFSP